MAEALPGGALTCRYTCSAVATSRFVALAVQRMQQPHALVIGLENPRRDVEGLERAGLGLVHHVGLDGIHGAAGPAVGVVDAGVAEQGIGRIAKYLQVARVGHVAVVVDPLRPHPGLEHAQRLAIGPPGTECGPCRPACVLVQPLFQCAQRGTGADVVLLQYLLDSDQIVIAQPLELADRAAGRLRLRTGDHLVDEPFGELRRLELGPRPLQARSELPQHVAHAGLAAGEVVDEVGAHRGPAQARAVDDRIVQLAGSGHVLVDHVQDLAPQRLLQPVGEVTRDLAAHPAAGACRCNVKKWLAASRVAAEVRWPPTSSTSGSR